MLKITYCLFLWLFLFIKDVLLLEKRGDLTSFMSFSSFHEQHLSFRLNLCFFKSSLNFFCSKLEKDYDSSKSGDVLFQPATLCRTNQTNCILNELNELNQ